MDSICTDQSDQAIVIATSGSFVRHGYDMDKAFMGKFARAPYMMVRPTVRATPWARKHDGFVILQEVAKARMQFPAHKIIVLAYSETAITVSDMINLGLFDPYNVVVVLMANGNRANGGFRSRFRKINATIADGKTPVIDIAKEYDGLSDYPVDSRNFLACANAVIGYLTSHGGSMKTVDFDKAVREYGEVCDNTVYITVPHPSGTVPLNRLLLALGLRFMPERWQNRLIDMIETRVNTGYYCPSKIGQDVKFRG